MGFLRSLFATALVGVVGVVSPIQVSAGDNISPVVEGMCIKYTPFGDLPCKIRVEPGEEVVHITDGHNHIVYAKISWMPYGWTMYVNGQRISNMLCSLDNNNFSCFTSINFVPNYEN